MTGNNRNSWYKTKWFCLFLLTFLWIIFALLVNPFGEFPLNDDWAYSKNVFNLVVNHILKFSDWPAMTLIAQTLWGAGFCSVFGFSFTTLRISVLILGWAGTILLFLLVRKFLQNDFLSVLFALILALNPFYFCLSFSFMTDVPFLFSTLAALYFYSCYHKDQKLSYLLLASGMALIATMIRQLGIWIAISMILTQLLTGRIRLKPLILQTFLAGVIICVFIGFTSYLKTINNLSQSFASFHDLIQFFKLPVFLHDSLIRGSTLVFYSGLVLLPLIVYVLPSSLKSMNPVSRWIAFSVSALSSVPLFLNLEYLPAGNIIYNLGLGPKLVKDVFWGFNIHPVLSPAFVQAVNVLGIAGGMLMVFTLIASLIRIAKLDRHSGEKKTKVQVLIVIAGYLGFLMIFDYFFDRYLLPTILFFILLLASPGLKVYTWNKVISITLLVFLAFFSISATHDYLSFNRARWDGLNNLLAAGVSPKNIDGGFEFNGWYETSEKSQIKVYKKSWWWVDDDTYLVSCGNVCGYTRIASRKYNSFLTFSSDSVMILKRGCQYQDSTVITCGAEALSKNQDAFKTSDYRVFLGDPWTRSENAARSGKYSVLLSKKQPFGFTCRIKGISSCEKFRISVWCKGNIDRKAGIVIAAPESKWLYRVVSTPQSREGDWELLETEVLLYMGYPYKELSVYLWNFGENEVYFDDLTIVRYSKPDF